MKKISRKTLRIRELNDQLRRTGEGGQIMITKGVLDLSREIQIKIFKAIKEFDQFNSHNDPYGERDFARVYVESYSVFWKIDDDDKKIKMGLTNPSDPDQTERVLTIMLAEEY